jgi:hypothetical protein
MINEQPLINTEDEIYAGLHEKLNMFMLKWPLFFEAVSFNLNEIEKLYENGIYSLRLTDYDEDHDRPFRLSFNGMFNHERIYYTISLDTTPKNLSTLTNDKFSPDDMYTDFWLIANKLFKLEIPNENKFRVRFYFDFLSLDIEEVRIMVKNTNLSIDTREFTHYIYEHNDVHFLNSHNANNLVNLKHLRNFYFIWQRSNIRESLISDDFDKSFFLYIKDVERYHTLIEMERI